MDALEVSALWEKHEGHTLRLYGALRAGVDLFVKRANARIYTWNPHQEQLTPEEEAFEIGDGYCETCQEDLNYEEAMAFWDGYNVFNGTQENLEWIAQFDEPERRERLHEVLLGLKKLPPQDFAWLRDLVNELELVSLLESKPNS